MATDITHEDFIARSSDGLSAEDTALDAARAQAIAEIAISRAAVSSKAVTDENTADYSSHDVTGVGRYVIPRYQGWKPLLKIIHDPVPNIDFSANIYDAFDGIIANHFDSPYLLNPLDDKYESYTSLRDNLAAVRNFLMQNYYAATPEGMTPAKAKAALGEIAAFVGDGLYNNFHYLHIIPNHNPTKPYIDLAEARRPDGEGAQYIYDKILEMQRHSNWMKPFAPIAALFGGKPAPEWMLPDAKHTHFTDFFENDIIGGKVTGSEPVATTAALEAATARLAAIDARRAELADQKQLTTVAIDLDAIGNHLLFTAENMAGVAHISEPVRRSAVDIAKDILRKLKVSIGDLNVMGGLNMKPSDDMAALGGVKGVAMVYERLLAWARGNNDAELLQDPSIIAATQAIGQLGYLAKLEARRMATVAGNTVMANNITAQLARIPAAYAAATEPTFGGLIDKVARGIDAVLNRVQQVSVSGAKVGLSVDNRGTTMDAPPTAGMARQVGADQTAALAAIRAAQLSSLAHTQHAAAQQNAATRPQQGQGQTAQQPTQQRQPAVGAGTRPTVQAGRNQPRSSSTSSLTTPPNGVMTPAQLTAMRSNAAANAAHHAHEREEAHQHEQQMLQQQRDAQQRANKAATKAAMAKIDPSLIRGFKNATNLAGVTGNGDILKPGRRIDPAQVMQASNKAQALAQTQAATAVKPGMPNDPLRDPNAIQPPTRGGGRGF
ncbi:MAG: hypothetical protein V4735_07730 [Pseudomonadota bacterium]